MVASPERKGRRQDCLAIRSLARNSYITEAPAQGYLFAVGITEFGDVADYVTDQGVS